MIVGGVFSVELTVWGRAAGSRIVEGKSTLFDSNDGFDGNVETIDDESFNNIGE